MSHSSRLTSKSQVTVPKDVREALGVGPGSRVTFEVGEDGRVMLVPQDDGDARASRKAKFLLNAAQAASDFGKNDPMPGVDGLAYQRMMRGDGPEV